jgi:hypothetical protein
MPVDIFVDKSPLTAPKASVYAGFNKLPVQKAKIKTNKINDLKSQDGQHKNIFQYYFFSFICA